jgi:hypothetical protein
VKVRWSSSPQRRPSWKEVTTLVVVVSLVGLGVVVHRSANTCTACRGDEPCEACPPGLLVTADLAAFFRPADRPDAVLLCELTCVEITVEATGKIFDYRALL